MVQAHIFYSGTVQGIGFRYTTQQFAKDFELAGWVKNLRDGRVEIIAEGEKNKIENFLRCLDQHFKGYIRDCEAVYSDERSSFKDFVIIP